jgi:flavodoxin
MREVIVYFTFGGSTKKEAERLAKEREAPAFRVMEARSRSLLASFIPGGSQAIQRKSVEIRPLDADLRQYDRIIIGCPVWGGYPAPAFNSILELLPAGREVEVFLCSGGGDTQKSREARFH